VSANAATLTATVDQLQAEVDALARVLNLLLISDLLIAGLLAIAIYYRSKQ
jgi:hypothetical protein